MKLKLYIYFCLTAVVVFASFACSTPLYEIKDLGTLGGVSSIASGINNIGQAVGSTSMNIGGFEKGTLFSYTLDSGMSPLTTPWIEPMGASVAEVNDFGDVVGYYATLGQFPYNYRAYVVRRDGQFIDLGTLGGRESFATDINNVGVICGHSRNTYGKSRAFVSTLENGMAELGAFAGGESWAYGLNDAGQIVGDSLVAPWVRHAFIYEPGQGISDLGTLGGLNSYARDVNEQGQVVGYSDTDYNYYNYHAFIYTKANGIHDLGTVNGNPTAGYAINNSGDVVGWQHRVEYYVVMPAGGFLYKDGVMYDLGSLLDESVEGWSDLRPMDINDRGEIIGYGTRGYTYRAFLMRPKAVVVDIDVEPWRADNVIKMVGNGFVRVLVFGSDEFAVDNIDTATVEFAGVGPEKWILADFDEDGDADAMYFFRKRMLNLSVDTRELTLEGKTLAGVAFEGLDNVVVEMSKQKGKKR